MLRSLWMPLAVLALSTAACTSSPEALYERARSFAWDSPRAVLSFRAAARQGHLEAQIELLRYHLHPTLRRAPGAPGRLEAEAWMTTIMETLDARMATGDADAHLLMGRLLDPRGLYWGRNDLLPFDQARSEEHYRQAVRLGALEARYLVRPPATPGNGPMQIALYYPPSYQ